MSKLTQKQRDLYNKRLREKRAAKRAQDAPQSNTHYACGFKLDKFSDNAKALLLQIMNRRIDNDYNKPSPERINRLLGYLHEMGDLHKRHPLGKHLDETWESYE